jgi:hypothetical protein
MLVIQFPRRARPCGHERVTVLKHPKSAHITVINSEEKSATGEEAIVWLRI